eukprot:TRINITY_DN18209_c1_g1_i2.p1 TRINITY_DN18209_c1_g1~~TRINITY_DN18209_c1_g1_i2.p1  ORF type:complete len:145 (-),score=9.93 TRINITY_DN18209_c1_g1_i2:207-641(-)
MIVEYPILPYCRLNLLNQIIIPTLSGSDAEYSGVTGSSVVNDGIDTEIHNPRLMNEAEVNYWNEQLIQNRVPQTPLGAVPQTPLGAAPQTPLEAIPQPQTPQELRARSRTPPRRVTTPTTTTTTTVTAGGSTTVTTTTTTKTEQ